MLFKHIQELLWGQLQNTQIGQGTFDDGEIILYLQHILKLIEDGWVLFDHRKKVLVVVTYPPE